MAELSISSVDELIMYLQSMCPLPFSEGLVERLKGIVRHRMVKRNEFLLRVGEVAEHIYFIQKGVLRCYYEGKKQEVTSWILREGDVVVSVQSFYGQKLSVENIQSIDESAVFYILRDELEEIYLEYPEFNYLGRVLTIRYLVFWNMQLYNLRMRVSEERFRLFMDSEDAALLLRVPFKFLASYLAMTPDTFSRMKNSRH